MLGLDAPNADAIEAGTCVMLLRVARRDQDALHYAMGPQAAAAAVRIVAAKPQSAAEVEEGDTKAGQPKYHYEKLPPILPSAWAGDSRTWLLDGLDPSLRGAHLADVLVQRLADQLCDGRYDMSLRKGVRHMDINKYGGEAWFCSFKAEECPFLKVAHHSNKQYLTITRMPNEVFVATLKCMADQCRGKRQPLRVPKLPMHINMRLDE
jgi:hypothetical protein